MLKVENLKVKFNIGEKEVEALKGVSFFINKGEIFGLVGESGSGKTVTAKSIIGLLPEQAEVSGKIIFDKVDLLTLNKKERGKYRGRRIAMIFQEPMVALNPTMRVGDQVAEVFMLHKGLSRKKALEKTINIFYELGIPEPEIRIKVYPHNLSGGMRQRIVIAMAIAADPDLLIADEPTTALDVTVQAQILALLKDMVRKRKMALLFVSHDLGVIYQMVDRLAVMYRGYIVEEGDRDEVFSRPLHPYTRDLLKALPDMAYGKFNLAMEEADIEGACPYISRCKIRTQRCIYEFPYMVKKANHKVRCFNAEG